MSTPSVSASAVDDGGRHGRQAVLDIDSLEPRRRGEHPPSASQTTASVPLRMNTEISAHVECLAAQRFHAVDGDGGVAGGVGHDRQQTPWADPVLRKRGLCDERRFTEVR